VTHPKWYEMLDRSRASVDCGFIASSAFSAFRIKNIQNFYEFACLYGSKFRQIAKIFSAA
jgi:hypothetical protein